MKSFRYVGQLYKQGSSSLDLIGFCASANDIRAWGGVPAKTERFHGGFQRALSDRYKKIKSFFDDGQASPTSVVVAFREGALKVSELGYPEAWSSKASLSQEPRFVHISFETDIDDEDTIDIGSLRKRVASLLEPRLDRSPQQSSGDSSEDGNGEEAEGGEEAVESSEEESPETADGEAGTTSDEDEVELDVGHSKLRAFYDFISDDDKVAAWLAAEEAKYEALKGKPRKNAKEQEVVRYTPTERLKYSLLSLLRPAMIVDGQHRVWGAYNSDKAPVVFSVCAIRDADWIEQVFQFVVLNKLARPISAGFLTSILNTSLTNSEVLEIEDRLDKIGIRNTERVIIKYLNHDERSPFFGLVAEPTELAGVDNEGKLSDKGMVRLAKRWHSLSRNRKELEMFVPALRAKNISAARKEWVDYETWTEFFFAFWKVIRERYLKDGVWEKKPGFHLLYIVTMHAMQDLFLEAKSKGDSTFKDLSDFTEQVEKYFADVPATFFQGWTLTGLQSGDGPTWIKKAIEMFRDGKRLGTVKEESELFQKAK